MPINATFFNLRKRIFEADNKDFLETNIYTYRFEKKYIFKFDDKIKKNEKRKRKTWPNAKRKAKAKRKSEKKGEPINKFMNDDDIIIEEFDD